MTSNTKALKISNLENKLEGGCTYPEWAEEMMTYMEIFFWDHVVKGTSSEPPADSPKHQEWTQIKRKAKAFIMLNTENTVKSLIVMEKSAKVAWDLLAQQYKSTTRTNLQALTDYVFELTFDG